jgi:lysophospholipase L1-like esterase
LTAKTVLCFGDSNTNGWNAETDDRFAADVRWPGVMSGALGDGWRVIEEGLGGRLTMFDDPDFPGRNGLDYLIPCLESHAPLDCVIVFVGINDLTPRFGLSADDAVRGVATLVEHVLDGDAGPDGGQPAVLVLDMPRLGPYEADHDALREIAAKVDRFRPLLRDATARLGVEYLDLSEVTAFSDFDPRHLDAAGHAAVGRAVAAAVERMFAAQAGP